MLVLIFMAMSFGGLEIECVVLGRNFGCPGLACAVRLPRLGSQSALNLDHWMFLTQGPALMLVLIFMAISFGGSVLYWDVIRLPGSWLCRAIALTR